MCIGVGLKSCPLSCKLHLDSMKLLNSSNIVILMDNTYKTKRYKMSLLEVVRITSTGLTFSVAFFY